MKAGDFIIEGGLTSSPGIVLTCGPKAFDIIWLGGSTTRYLHRQGRHITVVAATAIDEHTRRHLLKEAADAKSERARGARIRRGQVSPSR